MYGTPRRILSDQGREFINEVQGGNGYNNCINVVLFQNVLFLFRYFKCPFRCSTAYKRFVVEPFLLARTLEELGMTKDQAQEIIR